MDNLNCLFDYVFAHASPDFIDACETLRKELLKSMKIAKKFKEKLKLANLEKVDLIVRLDLLLGILMFLNLFMFVTFVVPPITFVLTVIN